MIIETIVNSPIDTNSYIIFEEKKNSIIIDPFDAELISQFLLLRELSVDYIILTHEHCDHIAGVNELCRRFHCKVVASETCSTMIQDPKLNLSSYFEILFCMKAQKQNMSNYEANVIKPFNCKGADIVFKDNFILKWGEHNLKLMETPGHALGSICILLDEQWIFTGDSLLADVDVITRLPGGSRKKYKEITLPILNDLSKDLQVYSGHGRSFKLGSMIL